MTARDLVSVWVVVAVASLFVAVAFDTAAWGLTGWGYAEEDTFYTRVGLWQICNGSREVSKGDKKEVSRSPPECVFPTSLEQDWIPKGLVMEIMGGFCALAIFIVLLIFLGGVKLNWVQSRSAFVAMVPLAFLSALMNFIGVLTIALNLETISCKPDYCVALDALAVVFFAIGGLCALLELQGCCVNRAPPIGKGLTRPI